MDAKEEGAVRTLLRAIADTAEPPSAVDVAAARRRGSRRLWVRRVALPAIAVVAVAGALTVPRVLVPGHSERTVASPQPAATSPVVNSPWLFDPLVPYASFGWLPAGFSESAANHATLVNQKVTSATDFVSREAAAPATERLLYLQVNARGTCALYPAGAEASVLAHGSRQVTCTDASFDMTGVAPDVRGDAAFWTDHGSGLAWQYAPEAWAELSAFNIGRGALPPSAATEALLLKVAAHVTYGDKTPLTFPFRLSGLPAGWRVWRASFTVSGAKMAGTGITAGPDIDTSALTINASSGPAAAACDFVPPGGSTSTSHVTRLGATWLYRKVDVPGNAAQELCATGPVDGLPGVTIGIDMSDPASGRPLPGAAQFGGAVGVLDRLRLLGANPAAWTANPVG
jgi:hypothetical protein